MLMALSNDRWLAPALTSKKLEQPETVKVKVEGFLLKWKRCPLFCKCYTKL